MRKQISGCVAVVLWLLASAVAAQSVLDQPVETGRSGGKSFGFQPLQEVWKKKRPRGPLMVAIPVAYRLGLAEGSDSKGNYCSPSIRINNSSNSSIEEIIVGIVYRHRSGAEVGRTITRIADIGIGHQDTQFFYQLETHTCAGLHGELSVVRCVYANGEDCTVDVRASEFGVIPLKFSSSAVSP